MLRVTVTVRSWQHATVLQHFNFFVLHGLLGMYFYITRTLLSETYIKLLQCMRIQVLWDVMLGCWVRVSGFL